MKQYSLSSESEFVSHASRQLHLASGPSKRAKAVKGVHCARSKMNESRLLQKCNISARFVHLNIIY